MRVYPGIAALCTVSAAHAAPLAHIARDIDSDGAIDQVSVEATGDLIIETKAAKRIALPLGVSPVRASVVATTLHGDPGLVVTLSSSGDEETVVVVRRGDAWRELVRERTGPVGEDGDFSIAIEADDSGVYRYQTRSGLRRCDGKPALLFADGWNGQRFLRLAKLPTGIAAGAPVIAAHPDAAPAPAPLVYQARLASHQPGAPDASALTPPTEISDRNISTFWHEEVVASAGEGQLFTFEAATPDARASRIRIVPRIPTPSGSARAFNRPRRIAIVGANAAWHIDVPDAGAAPLGTAYVADLPTPIEGCVTVVLESTYGPANGRTAIAELAVFAASERNGGGEAALARVIAEGTEGVNAATRALSQRGAAAVTAIDEELKRSVDAHARHRLAHALIEIDDAAAGPSLAEALLSNFVHERDLVPATRALAAKGLGARLRDVVARDDLAIEARTAAAHALAGNVAVLDLAGSGPQRVRAAVIESMSTIAAPVLVTAARGATSPAAAGDLWRAVTRRARATGGERTAAVTALTAAMQSATDYETRYRLVEGVATLGDGAALDALQQYLRQLPQSPARAAFEHVAARAIDRSPRSPTSQLVMWLVRESDPGVRAAALSALRALATVSTSESDQEVRRLIAREVQHALAGDVWPEVRRRAAHTLGVRCTEPEAARALAMAVRRDPDVDVRTESIGALVECRAAGSGPLLASIWNDGKIPIAVRTRAIELAGSLADSNTDAALVAAFDHWQREASESATALALAQQAAQTLGHLGPPGAATSLERATTSDVTELVAAAAVGLGSLGPRCPASAMRRLKTLASATDQQVRLAATRAASQCGK